VEHVQLGSTGLRVSRVCLGTMTFGLQCDEDESRAILDRAADGGVTFLDTADVYPVGGSLDTVGRTEEILGSLAAGTPRRLRRGDEVLRAHGPQAWKQGNSRKHILDAVEESLRRLDTDYIDLYQLHGPDPRTPLDETLEAMDSLVRSGKVRYIGVSNWLAWQLALAVGRAEARSLAGFVSIQPRYNLLFREFERELFPLCEAGGHRRDPLQPHRRWDAQRQARRRLGPDRGHPVHPRQRGGALPGPLLERPGVRRPSTSCVASPTTPGSRCPRLRWPGSCPTRW
jgi:1-deoxyxylulose-5-phosphate synthase